jgi:hypothetical protein
MKDFVHLVASRSGPRGGSRHSAAPCSRLNSRTEVCPPELWPASITWWGRVRRWMAKDGKAWMPATVRPVDRLALVKAEFRDGMQWLTGPSAERLADQIERARSLRELWHLRSPLYGLLAVQFDQREAEHRLNALNRHFPTRAPRSAAPAPLEA